MTTDDKAAMLIQAMGSRRGRMNLRESMRKPFGGLPSNPFPCEMCHLCALKESPCEVIRWVIDGKTCLVPAGTIFVWEEKQWQFKKGRGLARFMG